MKVKRIPNFLKICFAIVSICAGIVVGVSHKHNNRYIGGYDIKRPRWGAN